MPSPRLLMVRVTGSSHSFTVWFKVTLHEVQAYRIGFCVFCVAYLLRRDASMVARACITIRSTSQTCFPFGPLVMHCSLPLLLIQRTGSCPLHAKIHSFTCYSSSLFLMHPTSSCLPRTKILQSWVAFIYPLHSSLRHIYSCTYILSLFSCVSHKAQSLPDLFFLLQTYQVSDLLARVLRNERLR